MVMFTQGKLERSVDPIVLTFFAADRVAPASSLPATLATRAATPAANPVIFVRRFGLEGATPDEIRQPF